MECVIDYFPLVLYVLGTILLILLIILSIKAMKTLKKIDTTLDEVNEKVNKFNELFDVIDSSKEILATIGDKILGTIVNGIIGLFSKKTRKGEDENE